MLIRIKTKYSKALDKFTRYNTINERWIIDVEVVEDGFSAIKIVINASMSKLKRVY